MARRPHSADPTAAGAAGSRSRQPGVDGVAIVCGIVGVAMFAGTLPATRVAVTALDPLFVTMGRAALAGVLALIALAVLRQPMPGRRELPRIALVALCLVFAFPFLSALAMERVPASHGGVVLAVLPLATAAAARTLSGERPRRRFWLLSFAGASVVLVYALWGAGWRILWSDLYLVGAAGAAAVGYAVSGSLARRAPGWTVIAWALVVALPATLLMSGITAPLEPLAAGSAVWLAFAYLGMFSMLLGFVFWNHALARGGIAKIGQLQLLQPFMTIAIAAPVAGEPISLRLVGFAALVVVVVALAQRARVARVR